MYCTLSKDSVIVGDGIFFLAVSQTLGASLKLPQVEIGAKIIAKTLIMKIVTFFCLIWISKSTQGLDISRNILANNEVNSLFAHFEISEEKRDLEQDLDHSRISNVGYKTSQLPPPPPHTEYAKLARYITHYSSKLT